MENRYHKLLREHNEEILRLCRYYPGFFNLTAEEIEKRYEPGMKVLEIGCGEGDSALPVLQSSVEELDMLDISSDMIERSKEKLKEYSEKAHYICEDALGYLKRCEPYDIIFSSWTLHNFTREYREELLKTIYDKLIPGGLLIIADKVYTDSNWQEPLEKQNKIYRENLPEDVAKVIIEHETDDADDKYRMDEKPTLEQLEAIGFKDVKLIKRVEREMIIVANK